MRIENIKFRVWDKVSKKMLSIGLVDLEDKIVYSAGDEHKKQSYRPFPLHHDFLDVERLVFMQYTGILDKNGNDIYENDIVKNIQTKKVYRVVWNGSSAAFELEDEENQYKSLFFANQGFGRYEVIGNFFENHELLEEVQ